MPYSGPVNYATMGNANPWPVWMLQAGVAVAGLSVLGLLFCGLGLVLRFRVPRAWWAAAFGALLFSIALSGAAFWLIANNVDKVRYGYFLCVSVSLCLCGSLLCRPTCVMR